MAFPIYRRDQPEHPTWQIHRLDPLLGHEYIEIDRVRIHSPGRPEGVEWTAARRRNAVVIIPRLADGRFLLIRQERYPVQLTLWEFPAGMIDDQQRREESATILAYAARELAEETAHRLPQGGEFQPLGHYFSSPGFWDEHAYLFLADRVEPLPMVGNQSLGEGNETIHEARAFTAAALRQMVADGEIVDANTLAAWARLSARGLV